MPEDIVQLTDQAFRQADELTPDKVQQQYARHVASVLQADRGQDGHSAIGLLQADTGVGKTLGYLIPLLLKQAITGERVAVSTHTLALQDQITKPGGDIETALSVVQRVLSGHYEPKIRTRKGMGNFVSVDKIRMLCEAQKSLDGDLSPELQEFQKWAESSSTGELREWYEQHGDLPSDVISSKQIGLEPSDPEEQKELFRANAEECKDADVLIINHALALNHSMSRFSLLDEQGGRPLTHIVFDEADRVPDMARLLQANDLSLYSVYRALQAIHREIRTARKALSDVSEVWQSWQSLGQHKHFEYLDGRIAAQVLKDLRRVRQAISRVMPKTGVQELSQRQMELLEDMRDKIDAMDRFISSLETPGFNQVPIIRWSPTRRYPSLNLIPLQPGMALKPFWAAQKSGQGAYLESAIFTSATLGNQSSNVASSMGAPFGISPQYHHIAECARFEPTEFGKLGFVVPGPECPAPVEAAQEEEEAPNISPEWYQYAAAMIEEAHGRGGRALVLTPSYRDVNELTTRLSGCDNEAILGHFRGLQLKSLIPAFRSLENAILITPAGWEGLDLPGLIDHLIIARIPFAPPDRVVQRVMYNRYVQQRNMRHGEAQKVIYGNDLMNTVNRVRQGIGRAIRKNDDAATVWIADPRFPWPSKLAKDVSLSAPRVGHKRKALLQSIPSRFRESGMDEAPWERAEVFTASLEPAD